MTGTTALARMAALQLRLLHARLPCSTEAELQGAIVSLLTGKVFVEREVAIAGGRIDFRIDGIGVEAKVAGSAPGIYRQLCGYAAEPSIDGLLLVTSKAIALPPRIGGKPVAIVQIGRGWL